MNFSTVNFHWLKNKKIFEKRTSIQNKNGELIKTNRQKGEPVLVTKKTFYIKSCFFIFILSKICIYYKNLLHLIVFGKYYMLLIQNWP